MFEVGKKYKAKKSGYTDPGQFVITVLFSGKESSFVECLSKGTCDEVYVGEQYVIEAESYNNWEEYVEPKVEKCIRTVHIGTGRDGYFTSFAGAFPNPIGKIELTITDGKLTNVEIV